MPFGIRQAAGGASNRRWQVDKPNGNPAENAGNTAAGAANETDASNFLVTASSHRVGDGTWDLASGQHHHGGSDRFVRDFQTHVTVKLGGFRGVVSTGQPRGMGRFLSGFMIQSGGQSPLK